MTKSECIAILNKSKDWNFSNSNLYKLILEYLTDKGKSKSEVDAFFNIIILDANLLYITIKHLINYFIKKYQILTLNINRKIILYYE